MIGRFILGAGLGAVVGTGFLALASLTVPANLPAPPAPPEAPVPAAAEPAAGPVADAPVAESAPAEPVMTPETATSDPAIPETPPAPAERDEPEQSVEVAPEAAAEPAPAPAPRAEAAAPEAPEAPAAPEETPDDLTAEAATADLPGAPEAPAEPLAEVSPAAPAAPAPAPGTAAAEPPAAPAEPGATPDPAAPGLALAPEAPAVPSSPAEPAAEPAPAFAEEAGLPPLSPEEEALLAEIAENGPEALPDDLVPADPGPAPGLAAEPAAEPEPQPGLIVVGEGGSTLPSTPALPGSGAENSGLPQIGAGDAAAAATEPEAPVSTRPLDLYARPFENPAEKPLFAILLIDTGAPDLDRAALAALPFPVTFAIDPQDPQAGAHAATYRATGQEVVMLASALPRGAKASDVEVAFGVMEQALPEAVAVLDPQGRSFQGDRPLASLVVPVVGAGGRGLVTWNEGLNAADQVARREDVPAAVIFRKLDAEGEDSPVIRRYLDRAAFKAAQEGRVVVAGETRPKTVTALLEWAVEGRAATVALAPVTAVLSID